MRRVGGFYDGPGPAFAAVAGLYRQRILGGDLQPGDRLPSAADMARQLGVSVEVARRALAELRAEGLTVAHRGRGTRVRARLPVRRRSAGWYDRPDSGSTSPVARTVTEHGGTPSWEHASRRTTADDVTSVRLGIEVGDPVMRTDYTYKSDDVPIQLATSWEPLAVTGGTGIEWPEDGAAVGVVARFDHLGITIDAVEEVVRGRMPSTDERDRLRVAAGVPVLVIERTYRAGDRIVETADMVVPADRYELHYVLPVR